ncbi:sugar ABC transporter substrate-binding protein [Microbacterium ulmi]|uniref:Maltose ABC transporter substrate-binding protein n=1 Tax=Microbacterium ulmi TaxID=179095 RepID=A0A7Y2M0A2_9MICO|nr:maltose ABC transporter substrate-binding protein [Microbacterium ulmi]NII68750.1 arabinogalactan oligomer/maltooligosaccharide transport system substrate-binding protein [Microbacterium ulmi]NNH03589.1 maltose ABC transporter substrate-binding protein [Microbacterium ulmi]
MKVNKKGAVGLTALIAGSMLALAGCAGGGSSTPTDTGSAGTLTVWVDDNRAKALKDVVAQFEEEKGVDVNLVIKDNAKIRDDFTAQVPTGKGPDITIGAHDWLGAFVQDGLVAPIELGDKAADFRDVAVQAFTLNGQVYGLPYATENIALMRNADLVSEAPTSFDDMIAKGTAAGTKYPFVVGLDPANADPYHLYPFQTSFGNSVFAQNADGSFDGTQLTIGDEAGQNFATWLGAQGAAGTINLNLTQDLSKEAFNSGESPFILTGPWNVADAEAKGINIAIDPIPSAGGETAAPFVGVQGFYLSAKSTNTLLANEFLVNYLATPDVQYALYEAGDRPPANTEAYEKASSDPIIQGFGEVGTNGVPQPSIPEMGSVWEFWGVAEAAIIKGADPVATWTKMAADIQAKIDG